MARAGAWLKAQLGPSLAIGLCMLVMCVLSILTAFRIIPVLPPPWLGYAVLFAVVLSASLYWVGCVIRLWPRVVASRAGGYRDRSPT